MWRDDPNIEILQLAVAGLGPIAQEAVFLGGCATGLLITDPAAPPTRETKDVDVIVEIASRQDYYLLSERLRARDFREDQSEGAPMCRWTYRDVVVDVMPTDSAILGFSNRWYPEAMRAAEDVHLPGGEVIRMVSAPYFLATKLEAFYGRGNDDYMASHDLEDLIALLDGRESIVTEVERAGQFASISPKSWGDWQGSMLSSIPCLAIYLPMQRARQEELSSWSACVEFKVWGVNPAGVFPMLIQEERKGFLTPALGRENSQSIAAGTISGGSQFHST